MASKVYKVEKPKQRRVPRDVPRLESLGSGVAIDDEFDVTEEEVITGMKRILSTQWGGIPNELNTDFREHIEKFRRYVPRLVSRSHLYSLFVGEQSRVDKEVEALLRDGKLLRITTQNPQIKNDLLILKDDFVAFLDKQISLSGQEMLPLLVNFKAFVTSSDSDLSNKMNKTSLSRTFTDSNLMALTQQGFFAIVAGDLDHLTLSIPRFGFVVSLYLKCKTFITRLMKTSQWKEITHAELQGKWEKNKAKFKDLKGVHSQWALHFLVGEGVIEAFDTRDGRAYKLL